MTELERDAKDGILEQVEGRWQLRFTRRLPHSPEKVWRALTEEEHLVAWYPTTIEGELRSGAQLRFRFRGEEMEPMEGRMIACEPPRLLEFEERVSGGTGSTEHVRFEIAPDEGGCVLTFTTRYDEVGKSARDAAGWHVCFDLLTLHLAGERAPANPHERWKPLNERYAARFGPDAATIGPPEGFDV